MGLCAKEKKDSLWTLPFTLKYNIYTLYDVFKL